VQQVTGWRLNEKHLAKLVSTWNDEYRWEGRVPRQWAYYTTGVVFDKLPIKALTRPELVALAADESGYTDAEVFLSVMAWGGMNVAYSRSAWRYFVILQPIIGKLRKGAFSRQAAYAALSGTLATLPNPGMGPTYFTKLIYFCCPKQRGYIMDQWTGKSINLLFESADGGPPPVTFLGKRVSPKNSSERYEQFCQLVEALGERLGEKNGGEVERRLFSSGARGAQECGRWRRYVVNTTAVQEAAAARLRWCG
jgi:hypothetical protein